MLFAELISRKKEGKSLSFKEIEFLVDGYTKGLIPDEQMSAFLMAVYFQGMKEKETLYLTRAFLKSGEVVDLKGIPGIKVDKHSTGGVGDKTTLVLAPLIAAAGLTVAKLSGWGLGHTGGTLDKLTSIPNLRVNLSKDEFIEQIRRIKLSIASPGANLVPADKKIYALRDVTATVDSIPLIAASVMSKKIAGGADCILLDVKVGQGAFMKDRTSALSLAKTMLFIGEKFKKKTLALITDMNQPLGFAVGNALEVREAIAALSGKGPQDLEELTLFLGSYLLKLGGKVRRIKEGRKILKDILLSGRAKTKFKQMISAQGGHPEVVDNPNLLPQAKFKEELQSEESGYLKRVNPEIIGRSALILGAGRNKLGDKVDPAVGIVLKRKLGDKVKKKDLLAVIYANDKGKLKQARDYLASAYKIRLED